MMTFHVCEGTVTCPLRWCSSSRRPSPTRPRRSRPDDVQLVARARRACAGSSPCWPTAPDCCQEPAGSCSSSGRSPSCPRPSSCGRPKASCDRGRSPSRSSLCSAPDTSRRAESCPRGSRPAAASSRARSSRGASSSRWGPAVAVVGERVLRLVHQVVRRLVHVNRRRSTGCPSRDARSPRRAPA
jgi:hypothetical protein